MKNDDGLGVRSGDAKFAVAGICLALVLAACRALPGNIVVTETPAPTSKTATIEPTPAPSATVAPNDAQPPEDAGSTNAAEVAAVDVVPPLQPDPTPTLEPWVCPYLRGRTEIATLESQAMREQIRYLIHLPPCYDDYATKAFPSLYLFHGWPLDEWHWVNLGIAEWSDDWVSRGIVGPFIIVLPGVSSDGLYVNSSGGEGSFEGFVVNELVPAIDAGYRTIRDRSARAVGGISRGGVWALEIALRHQEVFSVVGGHSPALALNRPLPQYDPYRLIQDGVDGMRIYLDAGDRDWARAGAIQFRDALEAVAADVVFEVHEGGHVDALWRIGVPSYINFYTATWPDSPGALPEWAPGGGVGGGN